MKSRKNKSLSFVVIGLVAILMIAGFNPLFVETARAEGGLIVIGPGNPVYEDDQFSITVCYEGTNNGVEGATVYFNDNTYITDNSGTTEKIDAPAVKGDTDDDTYTVSATYGDLSGSTTVKIKNRYLVISSIASNPVNEGDKFTVTVIEYSKDHDGDAIWRADVIFYGKREENCKTNYKGEAAFTALPHLAEVGEDEDENGVVHFDIIAKKEGYKSDLDSIGVVNMNFAPNAPKKQPGGEAQAAVGIEYTYSSYASDPDGNNVYYRFHWGDGTEDSEWLGPYYSAEECFESHIWTKKTQFLERYDVKVKAKDTHGIEGEWGPALKVKVSNDEPDKPDPPSDLDRDVDKEINIEYDFTGKIVDPDGHKIYCQFDWDADGSHDYSDWLSLENDGSPSPSGSVITASHSWTSNGMYSVQVRGKDEYESKGKWSKSLGVVIGNLPPNKPSKPKGQTYVFTDTDHKYTSTISDPNEDLLYYKIEGGNGGNSEWIGPVPSGTEVSETFSWAQEGHYTIFVYCKDEHDVVGPTSEGTVVKVYEGITDAGMPLTINLPNAESPTNIYDMIPKSYGEEGYSMTANIDGTYSIEQNDVTIQDGFTTYEEARNWLTNTDNQQTQQQNQQQGQQGQQQQEQQDNQNDDQQQDQSNQEDDGSDDGDEYTLTVNLEPSSHAGTVSPNGGTYEDGELVTLTANANSGYVFDRWSGALSGSSNPVTITMDSDKIVTAHFAANGGPMFSCKYSEGIEIEEKPDEKQAVDVTVDVTIQFDGSGTYVQNDAGIDEDDNDIVDNNDLPDVVDSCFLAGTKITMADGTCKDIKDVKVDELVLSIDEEQKTFVGGKVTKILSHSKEDVRDYYLVIQLKSEKEEINEENKLDSEVPFEKPIALKVTPNHPIYIVADPIRTSETPYKKISAGEIKPGDKLYALDEQFSIASLTKKAIDGHLLIVSSVEKVFENVPTFNIEVEKHHKYFANGILVGDKTRDSCESISKTDNDVLPDDGKMLFSPLPLINTNNDNTEDKTDIESESTPTLIDRVVDSIKGVLDGLIKMITPVDDKELVASEDEKPSEISIGDADVEESEVDNPLSLSDELPLRYFWDFGEGTPLVEGLNPIHTYQAAFSLETPETDKSDTSEISETKDEDNIPDDDIRSFSPLSIILDESSVTIDRSRTSEESETKENVDEKMTIDQPKDKVEPVEETKEDVDDKTMDKPETIDISDELAIPDTISKPADDAISEQKEDGIAIDDSVKLPDSIVDMTPDKTSSVVTPAMNTVTYTATLYIVVDDDDIPTDVDLTIEDIANKIIGEDSTQITITIPTHIEQQTEQSEPTVDSPDDDIIRPPITQIKDLTNELILQIF